MGSLSREELRQSPASVPQGGGEPGTSLSPSKPHSGPESGAGVVMDLGLRQHLSQVTTASDGSSLSLLCPLQTHLRALLGWHSGV